MKTNKNFKLGIISTVLFIIPTTTLAEYPDKRFAPRVSLGEKIFSPVKKLQEMIDKAFRENILLISSQDVLNAERKKISIEALKEQKKNEFCAQQGFVRAKSADWSGPTTEPVTAYKFNKNTGRFVKDTFAPLTKEGYFQEHYSLGLQEITKAQYLELSKIHRAGEVNKAISKKQVPVEQYFVSDIVCTMEVLSEEEMTSSSNEESDDDKDSLNSSAKPARSKHDNRVHFEDRSDEDFRRPSRFEESRNQRNTYAGQHPGRYEQSAKAKRQQRALERKREKEYRDYLEALDLIEYIFDAHREEERVEPTVLNQLRRISSRLDSGKSYSSPVEEKRSSNGMTIQAGSGR